MNEMSGWSSYLPVIASYFIFASYVVALGVHQGGLDTVSRMVAQSEEVRVSFAFAALLSLTLQIWWLHEQLERRQAPQGRVWTIDVGVVLSYVGTAGYSFYSVVTDETAHVVFAGVAFAGGLLYLLPLLERPRSWATVAWVMAAACAVLLAFHDDSAWRAALEYILITALHLCALLVTQ